MRLAADFHIHSHFSRATSPQLTPAMLDLWGRIKGLSVVGTGDFTHPGWLAELQEELEPAEAGLFTLKEESRLSEALAGIREGAVPGRTRFLLTTEISSIYKQGGKVRKVHNVIFVPDFNAAVRIQQAIERLGGNIRSDGRPILGLDSRDLLELSLEADERIFFVPAHIWTPWFSALGSKSGFDSIQECYRDLSDHIFAVETGLSSDPPMNWMCSFLDGYTLISNSDAHSPEKLGREASLFDCGLSYSSMVEAMKRGAEGGFDGTIEFFPQEGKYHFDGHRKCGVVWDPLQTLRANGRCPVCGKPVTVGVVNRVAQLADRSDPRERPNRAPYYSLVPLKELLGEIEGVGPGSKRVQARFAECVSGLGPELDILLNCEVREIEERAGKGVARSVERMRQRLVSVESGYDGEYGSVRVWEKGERPETAITGANLFDSTVEGDLHDSALRPLGLVDFDLPTYQRLRAVNEPQMAAEDPMHSDDEGYAAEGQSIPGPNVDSMRLNAEQELAVKSVGAPSLIIAGPGTGKTHTVAERIRSLVDGGTAPDTIWAITFANKAADELRRRLLLFGVPATSTDANGPRASAEPKRRGRVRVSTFHSLGLGILKQYLPLLQRDEDFLILDEPEKLSLFPSDLVDYVAKVKNGVLPIPGPGANEHSRFREYQETLKRQNCFDYEDLIYFPVRLIQKRPDLCDKIRGDLKHLIIDEYQDINPMQYELVKALASGVEICAVGDPNQAIYGFRGASPRFIERFGTDFPGARTFALSRSYRCTDELLEAAAQVLGRSGSRVVGAAKGAKVAVFRNPSAAFEAERIARDIEVRAGGVAFFSFDSGVAESAAAGSVGLSEIAVLCRTSLQMPTMEKAFNDHRIPFRTIRTETLFAREPYRSFLNFVRLLLRRGRHGPVGTVKKLTDERLREFELPDTLTEALHMFAGFYFSRPDDPRRTEMALELARYWPDPKDARAFVERARLGSGPDRHDPRVQAVALMTIHAAKGLEFDVVYVPGCEDTLLPCTISGEGATDVEEEKRLLFVAMTRARHTLILSSARSRVIFGRERHQEESPFLSAIEEALVERQTFEVVPGPDKTNRQLGLFD